VSRVILCYPWFVEGNVEESTVFIMRGMTVIFSGYLYLCVFFGS